MREERGCSLTISFFYCIALKICIFYTKFVEKLAYLKKM